MFMPEKCITIRPKIDQLATVYEKPYSYFHMNGSIKRAGRSLIQDNANQICIIGGFASFFSTGG